MPSFSATLLPTSAVVPAGTGNAAEDMGQIAVGIAQAVASGGGYVDLLDGGYALNSYQRTISVTVAANSNAFTVTSGAVSSADVGRYFQGAHGTRPLKIATVPTSTSFTTDANTVSAITASAGTVNGPGIVVPYGVTLRGRGRFSTATYFDAANPTGATALIDAGDGMSIMLAGSESVFGTGNTGFGADWGVEDLAVRASTTGAPGAGVMGVVIPNGCWFARIRRVDASWYAIAGFVLDDNMNNVELELCSSQANGTAAATTPTGGLIASYWNAVTSAAVKLIGFVAAQNYGVGIQGNIFDVGGTALELSGCQSVFTKASAWAGGPNGYGLALATNGLGLSKVDGGFYGPNVNGDLWVNDGPILVTAGNFSSTVTQIAVQNAGILTLLGTYHNLASPNFPVALAGAGVVDWIGCAINGTATNLYSGGPTPAQMAGVGSSSGVAKGATSYTSP